MCFSPEIDVAAGVVVGAIGLETLRHVHHRRDVALGSLPVLFGVHQLTEAFVWWGLTGETSASAGRTALWAYVVFAFVVLPVLAPLAVARVEPELSRRRLAWAFTALGVLVAVTYLSAMLEGPVRAAVSGNTLTYRVGVEHGGLVAALYMLATVGALLASSHRRIAAFGAVNLLALPALILLATHALTSLWCLWAAVTSIVIAAHFHDAERARDPNLSRSGARPGAALSGWLDRVHFRPD